MTTSPVRPDAPSSDHTDDPLVTRSVELAVRNVAEGGKPFACIVRDDSTGEVLVEATNQVSQSGDRSAHAEIVAIRELAAAGRDGLRGCTVFVTAYPCPMCLGALYYAEPEQIVFAATREQESESYEDGNRYMSLDTFYAEYAKQPDERALPAWQGETSDPCASFVAWAGRHGG